MICPACVETAAGCAAAATSLGAVALHFFKRITEKFQINRKGEGL